jgi:hypothetical protein
MAALVSVRTVVALVLAAMAGPAMAQQPSGTAIAVVQQANIDGQTGFAVLQAAAPVYSGDRIETGPVGEAQIKFRDDTRLVIGPKSSMVIDAFVFNNDDTARDVSINILRGAFRFISGNSSKDAYSITTPTATIGVRGTEFDVAVEGPTGVTRVVNFEGVVRLCRRAPDGSLIDPAQNCLELVDPCSLSVIRPRRDIVRYGGEDVEFRNRQLRSYFPYVRSQASLLSDFRVDVAQCNIAGVVAPDAPGVLPPPPPGPPGPPVIPDPPDPAPTIFTEPPPPSPADRHDSRPVYPHGPVFR